MALNDVYVEVASVGIQGLGAGSGATGAIGLTGATGATGPAGTSINIVGSVATSADLNPSYTGTIGDAYLAEDTGHIWIWNGTTWIDGGDIKGPTGATGPQGDVGATGIQGNQGATGLQGASGLQGIQGASGIQGNVGASGVGLTGATGIQGNVGATGAQGQVGASGSQGAQGASGSQGIQGASGAQGNTGQTGATGIHGASGATGSQGVQGATGVGLTGATGIQGVQGASGVGATGLTGASGAGIQPTQVVNISGLNQTLVETVDSSLYRSARYDMQGTAGSNFMATELRLLIDGPNVFLTEYGTIGDALGVFDTYYSPLSNNYSSPNINNGGMSVWTGTGVRFYTTNNTVILALLSAKAGDVLTLNGSVNVTLATPFTQTSAGILDATATVSRSPTLLISSVSWTGTGLVELRFTPDYSSTTLKYIRTTIAN